MRGSSNGSNRISTRAEQRAVILLKKLDSTKLCSIDAVVFNTDIPKKSLECDLYQSGGSAISHEWKKEHLLLHPNHPPICEMKRCECDTN